MRMRFPAVVATIFIGMELAVSGTVYCQTTPVDLPQVLEKAKQEFKLRTSENDKKLMLAIQQRLNVARKTGDKPTLERVQQELDEFVQEGTPPASLEKASQTYQRQSTAARAKLEQVYRNQIKAYVKQFDDANADALEADLQRFLVGLEDLGEPELIRNGGCEEELTEGNDGAWVAVLGVWQRRKESPAPRTGSFHFWAGYEPLAELTQDIDLRKLSRRIDDKQLKTVFSCYVRTLPQIQTNDTSRVVIEFLDAKKKVLETYDSGESANAEDWMQISDTRVPVKGTRWVRVRLVSKKNEGEENNGYFDDVSLQVRPANDTPTPKK